MAKQKKAEFSDFGLGEKSSSEGFRALNKDGSFNIEKTNIPFFERLNFFLCLFRDETLTVQLTIRPRMRLVAR